MMDRESLLLLQVKYGDKKAFEPFVERFWKPIFHLAYRFTGSSHDAEDLCQEIFLCVYQKAETFRGEGRAFTWLYRIATNVCLNWKRKEKPRLELPAEEISPSGTASSQALLRLELREAFSSLSPEDRLLMLLRKFYGFSYEEMGEMLSIPQAKVKSRLHEAKTRLAGKLKLSVSIEDSGTKGGESWTAPKSS